jgi:hypothetical protein
MNEIYQSVSFLSAGAAGALLSAVWEGAVLALCVYACLRMLPGLSAAFRSVVWLNVFVLLVLLHFVAGIAPRAVEAATGREPAVHLDPRWSLGIVAVWLAFSLWRALQLVLGIVHVCRLAARAVPVAVDGDLQVLLADAPGGHAAKLCTSDEVRRPSVLGFFRPQILMPPALVEGLTPQELQQVVLHEMEHLRRGDDWTNLLQKIGLVLFPLNPVLVWVERRLCAERELACDDRVIRSSAGRKAYALCLTRLAELSLFRRGFSLVLGLWERRPELVRRVQRIVSQPVRVMGRRPAMVATGSVLAGALGCAVALAHSPQFVSFVPVHPAVLLASPLDPHELARTMGGTPQLVKATMPVRAAEPAQPAGRRKCVPRAMHRAVLKAAQLQPPAGSQIASLDPGLKPAPAPPPTLDRSQLIVLTEVTTFQAAPRAVLAVSTDRRAAPAVAIPAAYAIIPVPNGWLIIKI